MGYLTGSPPFFWVTPRGVQRLLLHSRIILGVLRGPCGMPGIQPRSAMFKARALPHCTVSEALLGFLFKNRFGYTNMLLKQEMWKLGEGFQPELATLTYMLNSFLGGLKTSQTEIKWRTPNLIL